MYRYALFLLFNLGLGVSLAAQTAPAITSVVASGGLHIDGTAQTPTGTYSSVTIYVCIASPAPAVAYDCSARGAATTPTALTGVVGNTSPVDANGNFGTTLNTAMKAGDSVWVTELATPAAGGSAVPKLSTIQTIASTTKRPTITGPVKDQANPIVGSAIPSTASAPVQVQLYIKDPASGLWQPQGGTENVGSDGTYTLHETVTQGETIHVEQTGTAVTPDTPDVKDSVDTLVLAADNEREHIDFFAGTVISQSESNFAQADTFLALNVDRALKLPGLYANDVSTCGSNGTTLCKKPRTPGMNAFFQARLTTIPVNASTTTTTSMATSGGSTSISTAPSLSSVISSQKTGHFEAGFYTPFTFGAVPGKTPKAPTGTFYFAPLFRFGFNTLASNDQTSTSTSAGTTTTTSTTALGTSNPLPTTYNFFILGGRIGTAAIDSGSLRNVHYLDIGVGKFSNLENLLCKAGPNLCANTTTENRYRPYRLSFEGYYQIPTTGFILGMSANVGPGFFDRRANTDVNNRAPGDLRFLFGYKFDAIKLFKALPMISQ